MPLEIGLWRVGDPPRRMFTTAMPLEARLEDLIEADSGVLGEPLLFLGRQVPTAHGKFIDLLAVGADGVLHVIELKRDRTPRDVVGQALDYGSWVETLNHEDVLSIFERYRPGVAFEQAFSEQFGVSPPEELNSGHRLTVVASEVDPATARIVEYLARYEVPLNVLFFRHFLDDDRAYIARTWLVDDIRAVGGEGPKMKTSGSREPWNGKDWYVSFGEESRVRSWDDAREYGFVSAGGGAWHSRTLRSLPIGARVFVCIPGAGVGYVGVGTVSGEAKAFDDAVLDRSEAVWEKGFFANQHSACKLRNRFTLDSLLRRFQIDG